MGSLSLFQGIFPTQESNWGFLHCRQILYQLKAKPTGTDRQLVISITGHACCARLLQLCLTLCDPMACCPPGSSVHGILQARILVWVAMPSSRGIFLTQGSNHISFGRRFFTTSTTWDDYKINLAAFFSLQFY